CRTIRQNRMITKNFFTTINLAVVIQIQCQNTITCCCPTSSGCDAIYVVVKTRTDRRWCNGLNTFAV
ncbi:hypothetical protein, partial [Kingella kingae]|uniref:hypothetical protein n=1 Tax=Kingella kingae TaxID=504 RepID=UPI00254BAB7B